VNAENLGVNKCWNKGIEMATGDYVAVCNNDIIFAPGWDKGLLDALDAGAGIVSPLHTFGPEKPKDWPHGNGRQKNPISGISILGCCFAFKSSLWKQIDPIPEQLRSYYGDNWIDDQAARLDMTSEYVPGSYIHHFYMQTTARDPEWIAKMLEDEKAYRSLEVAHVSC
jgi:GT2 family glycosyltransferase